MQAKESGLLDCLYPAEADLTLLEETVVTVPMIMGESESISALEDGTWAWRYGTKVYYMFSQPSEIIVRAKRYTGTAGYDESANEDVVLPFRPLSAAS